MATLQTKLSHRWGKKVILPEVGIVEVANDGTFELDEADWKTLQAIDGFEELKIFEIKKGEKVNVEELKGEELKGALTSMALPQLFEVAESLGRDESEWKHRKKGDLTLWIIAVLDEIEKDNKKDKNPDNTTGVKIETEDNSKEKTVEQKTVEPNTQKKNPANSTEVNK